LPTSLTQHLKGAISVNWQDFSRSGSAQRGNLIDDVAVLEEKIRALGISNDVPVVVFGNPVRGWGEDGRIVWMLRSLGHNRTVLVDGGIQALIQAGVPATGIFPSLASPNPGTFRAQPSGRWQIERDDIKQQLVDEKILLIDTRETREYNGQTPYGEQRGGHLPGAIHIYFKEFLASDGTLLPHTELVRLLDNRGITSEQDIVAYCTGGVRSAWVTAVLHDLGYSVKNYAGSTWEWAASAPHTYPLETSN
jgi:thiosulfate/3-mercaptopyruvate sulfurtransferase